MISTEELKRGTYMKIGVIGAGTWGIALARMLTNSGHKVTVWSALEEEIDELSGSRRHKNLPGMVIPNATVFTKDLKEAADADIILMAVPSIFVRSTTAKIAPFIKDGQIPILYAPTVSRVTIWITH